MFMRVRSRSDKRVSRVSAVLMLAFFFALQTGFLGIGSVSAGENAAPASKEGVTATKSVTAAEGVTTTNSGTATKSGGANDASGRTISIEMIDTDVRDILSAIAICMDANIIYMNTPTKVTFSVKNVSPEKALELLIESIDSPGGQLGYIKDGNTIIIGSSDKLQKDFFNQMALTRFKVSYISPSVLSEQLDKLNIPIVKVTLDKSSKYIWVQGTAKALSKVASVISALDRPENFDTVDGEVKAHINLEPITLKYVTGDEIAELIKQLEIDAKTIKLDSNPGVMWITGSQQAMQDIKELVSRVDIPQSMGNEFKMSYVKLKNITYDKLNVIAEQLNIPVQIIRVGSGQKSLWLKGAQKDIDELNSLIGKFDIPDNGDEVQFFTYTLKNISPDDAKLRLDFLGISGVSVMTLNYPAVSREILIKCPYDMIGTVTRALANIDIQGQKIIAAVDNAKSAYQLTKRKELLCRLTGIPAERFTISDNIAKDGADSFYIMYIEDTPDNIKRIKEIVKMMDTQ